MKHHLYAAVAAEVDADPTLTAQVQLGAGFSRALIMGNEILIGHNILQDTGLIVNPITGKLEYDPRSPDQPVFKVK